MDDINQFISSKIELESLMRVDFIYKNYSYPIQQTTKGIVYLKDYSMVTKQI